MITATIFGKCMFVFNTINVHVLLITHNNVCVFLLFISVPYQGAQMYSQGGYGQAGAGPWSQYPYSQAYGQAAAAQVCMSFSWLYLWSQCSIVTTVIFLNRLLLIQVLCHCVYAMEEEKKAFCVTCMFLHYSCLSASLGCLLSAVVCSTRPATGR